MSVMVHSVHNNILPHIATPCCLFCGEFQPWLTMSFLAWLSRRFGALGNMRLPRLLVLLSWGQLHPFEPDPPDAPDSE